MSTPTPKPPRIDVVELKTGKVVYSFPLNSTGSQHVEKVMRGLLRNMDTERFVAKEVLE